MLRWGAAPVVAALLVGVLLRVVPGSGPVVHLVGPFAVQSLIGLVVGFLLIAGAGAPTVRIRQAYFLVAAVALATSCWAAALPIRASQEVGTWMGDYDTYTTDREHFEEYFGYGGGYGAVRFHYHLGGFVLELIDRALGSTNTSFHTAFRLLPALMGVVALLEAVVVAVLAGWSAQSMRYVGLCIAAPLTLMFFGYRELGYMSLSIAAMPLYLMTLDRPGDSRNRTLIAGAASLQGLHAALHGLGLSGIASLMAMALASARGLRQAIAKAGPVFTWAFIAYATWLPIYLIVLGLPIVPGHASGIVFRGAVESQVSDHRLVEPLLSLKGMRDIGAEALVVGLPVVLIGLKAARGESRRAVLAAAAVSGAVMLLLWPAQGIGQDIDIVLATFPAFFAGAWLCAARPRAAVAALCTLAIGHAVFWLIVRSEAFTNPGI